MTEQPESKVYTATEVAAFFRVHPSTVTSRAKRDGHFMGAKSLRVGRRVLFARAAIDAIIAAYEQPIE